MNKQKFFNAMAAGILMTTSLAPIMTVSAQNVNETNDSEIENLLGSYMKETSDNGVSELIDNITIEQADKVFSIKGTLPSEYSMELAYEGSNEMPNVQIDGEVDLELSIVEIEENNLQLSILHNNDVISVINLVDLLTLKDEEVDLIEEAEEVTEEVREEETPEIEVQEPIEETEVEVEIENETGLESPVQEETVTKIEEIQEEQADEQIAEQTAPRAAVFSRANLQATSQRKADNGIYTVTANDTFSAIATSFNLSTLQLREWNRHVSNINILNVGEKLAVTRTGVERMLPEAQKKLLYKGGAVSPFQKNQDFIDAIAPLAIEIAAQTGQPALWPSLMIAQAAHESNYGRSSLASAPYHNLSGIKGSYNNSSVLMWTWEVVNGTRVNVLANFRHYPSYTASLQDYSNLLRNGLSWSKNYYSGTWRNNTNSVWEVLDNKGLKGYATDPNYYTAIRRTINSYNLTKYDTGNYYVRTGTFLGEDYTQIQLNKLKKEHSNYSYRLVREDNKTPYSYRRVESANEFLGKAGAQRAVDKMKRDKGWSATIVPTGNGTKRNRVWSGWFNSLSEAQAAATKLAKSSNYAVVIDKGQDGKYRIRTGFFNTQNEAQKGLQAMRSLGWSAKVIESNDSTPHYKIRTGTFNTPNHVNSAKVYFNANKWGSKEILDTRDNYYYRIIIEGFDYKDAANSYVSHLNDKHSWFSKEFSVDK